MNRLISWVKNIRLGKVITVFLSTILLFVSTACNSGSDILTKTADQVREEVPGGAVTSPYKGGINNYSDVDPRQDTSRAEAKAKALIDNAERNVINQSNDVGTNTKRILDKKGENIRDLGQNLKENAEKLGDQAQKSSEDFARGVKQGTENIKENAQNAAQGTKRTAENVKENTKDAGEGLADKAKEAASKTAGYFQQKAEQAASSVKQGVDKAVDAID